MKTRCRLRQARQLAGYSQGELARRAGMKDKSTISRIELCGSARPATILKLAKVLGYPPHVLFPQFPEPIPDYPPTKRKRCKP